MPADRGRDHGAARSGLRRPALDLEGRVFIDDSQPGCVDRDQWEKRGGVLLWPTGSAAQGAGPLHRQNGYRFGDGLGMLHPDDLWGCEAEVAAIALTGQHQAALRSPVTVRAVHEISALYASLGIHAAEPQSYGTAVSLNHDPGRLDPRSPRGI
ncbi:hypothetical protein R1T08_14680 [Streptomyces sp. SBC-4]|nr:hypothetical protein [Streptomyces sp. SBC-4]MDV5145423.1 hypothetical protein [Streptomyces sp. SBC-4]